jgi:hypothetical protein
MMVVPTMLLFLLIFTTAGAQAAQTIKDVHPATACTAAGLATCSITVTWPGTAFPDSNYTAVCTAGDPLWATTISNKTTTTIRVTARNFSGGSNTFNTANCIAVHD